MIFDFQTKRLPYVSGTRWKLRETVAAGGSQEGQYVMRDGNTRFLWWFDLILDPDVFFVFFLVLLESVLCWRCRENGSAEVSKVRHDQLKHLFQLFFFVITLCNLFKILYVLTFCFFVFFFPPQASWTTEWVGRCCSVLHALHPRHFLLWGEWVTVWGFRSCRLLASTYGGGNLVRIEKLSTLLCN